MIETAPQSESDRDRPVGAESPGGFVAGIHATWPVRVLWIVALVGPSPVSSKQTGAQKNDAVKYLPSSRSAMAALMRSVVFCLSRVGPVSPQTYVIAPVSTPDSQHPF
jgi:hypothetical protein